jgi:hypothetical protein
MCMRISVMNAIIHIHELLVVMDCFLIDVLGTQLLLSYELHAIPASYC